MFRNFMSGKITEYSREENRLIPFQKVTNFRDLGGYQAADGRTVRWGVLYRSGNLAKLSRQDQEVFGALKIDTLVDFRSVYERERDPTGLAEEIRPIVLELPVMDEANEVMRKEIRSRIENKKYDDLDSSTLMLAAYRQFALDFLEEYRQFFQAVLAADGKPVLWHCTAGKDRTGFAAAVLLKLLGVDWDIIMADYLLSNDYVDQRRGQMLVLRLMRGRGAVNLIRPLLTVHASWLEGAFEVIEEEWGSFERYLEEGLGLDEDDITQLKKQLLESS
jgi:protein-tyrosine phosphatase